MPSRTRTPHGTTALPPASALPCLKAGGGLPARCVVLCDGRTSLRLSQDMQGFDSLVHYAPDSFYTFSRVLNAEGQAMRWTVDGAPQRFDWTQVLAFGCDNTEDRPDAAPLACRALVVQNSVLWQFRGVRRSATLRIPAAMFANREQRDDRGNAIEVLNWSFAKVAKGTVAAWTATRQEDWLFRDSSTYAGLAGKKVASEPRTSQLHLCILGSQPLRVHRTADTWEFELRPDADGSLALSIGLGSGPAEARLNAEIMLNDADGQWEAQTARYAEIAHTTPTLDFGRHTALRQFFRLQPHYLESMRIREQPGAYRANNDYYWVWGWDMTRPAFGLLTGNRHEFVRGLLDFQHATSYINQYDNTLTRDLRTDGGQPGALEYMLAHDYLAWSGDVTATRAWKPKFLAALTRECENPDPTGMWPGTAASTDFPEEFGRTFQAWLAYTMSWHYAGLLCAEKLLLAWDETALAARVRTQALKIRRNFERVFWNPQTGFWNEGVHAANPDLVCDIPLSTAMAAMDSPYGEDLYGGRLQASADYVVREFLREDGVSITCRNETRGWKEWTRQPRNWFAANDTMLVRLLRSTGNVRALEKLFYLYELNFGYQPCVFEGKPLHRPLFTSGSWQAFGAGAWYRNLVEGAAGLWADLGGLGLMPGGLGEPVHLTNLKFRDSLLDFTASGQGLWPVKLEVDGRPLQGTTKFPPFAKPGPHRITVEYGPSVPEHPILTLAVDAAVTTAKVAPGRLTATLTGNGYTPVSFFSPGTPQVTVDGAAIAAEWDSRTGRGRTRFTLTHQATLEIIST